MKLFQSLLTNPLLKTLATGFVSALFVAADSAITNALGSQNTGGSLGIAAALGLTLAHNVLSYERDRIFGETAAPATAPKEVNPPAPNFAVPDVAPVASPSIHP